MLCCKKYTILVTCQGKLWKFGIERLLIFWLTNIWLRTFYVTNQVKWRMLRCKKYTLLVTCQGKQWKFGFERLLVFWLTKIWLRTFYVTNQVKRQMHRCKKYTILVTCQGKHTMDPLLIEERQKRDDENSPDRPISCRCTSQGSKRFQHLMIFFFSK